MKKKQTNNLFDEIPQFGWENRKQSKCELKKNCNRITTY